MAIFSKSAKSRVDRSNTTVIAAGTKVKGDIQIECKLHVDGEFAGSIHSNNLVTVGKTGAVEGDIVGQKLVVTGHFMGNADCDEITILSGGRVVGHLASKVLVIERNSSFEGESRLKDSGANTQGADRGATGTLPASVAQLPSADMSAKDKQTKESSEKTGAADTGAGEAALANVAQFPSAPQAKKAQRG